MLALAPIILLAGFFARADSGAVFDFEAEGFWSRKYQIPSVYATYKVEVSVEDVAARRKEFERAAREAGGRPAPDKFRSQLLTQETVKIARPDGNVYWTTRARVLEPGSESLLWQLPPDKARGIVDAALDWGDLVEFKSTDLLSQAKPNPAELPYKKEKLLSERALIVGSSAEISGILALLDAQIAAVEGLVKRHDEAAEYALVRIDLTRKAP